MAAAIATIPAKTRAGHLKHLLDFLDAMEQALDECNHPDNETADAAATRFDFYNERANYLSRMLAMTRVEEPQAAAAAPCPVAQMEALSADLPAPAAPAELTPEQRLALFRWPSARATMFAAARAPHPE